MKITRWLVIGDKEWSIMQDKTAEGSENEEWLKIGDETSRMYVSRQ